MKLRTASILSRYQMETSDVGGESFVHCYIRRKIVLKFYSFLT